MSDATIKVFEDGRAQVCKDNLILCSYDLNWEDATFVADFNSYRFASLEAAQRGLKQAIAKRNVVETVEVNFSSPIETKPVQDSVIDEDTQETTKEPKRTLGLDLDDFPVKSIPTVFKWLLPVLFILGVLFFLA